jgi:hypothetical protein
MVHGIYFCPTFPHFTGESVLAVRIRELNNKGP